MSLKSFVVFLTLPLMCAGVLAQVEPVVIAQPQQLQSVCWFEGRKYSQGARIEMVGRMVLCAPRDPLMIDGPLVWLSLDEQDNPVYPEPRRPNKITINKNQG
ncbi:DUF1496 domain-containing protein [Ferrimonas sediminicola]|uniref:DUF1496 domain-containing protein n=1 Tax=Ferrimonas sediminicola TaxID=2569538 RepID=A0A4U1BKE9_9GAMM|nr:DUF1496 domain-containing protein [Ferrimonas sediminicola]TKB51077.1 DUF1496 domain-containing protein [Ferrimonas sediminicola]